MREKRKNEGFDQRAYTLIYFLLYFRTYITMELENIGNIAVDFITLSFTDSTTIGPLAINPELPPEEQYEIELHTKGTRVFSWEGTDEKESTNSIGKIVWIPQGKSITLKVNVFGKRDW